ncbi:hypothetical protein Adt_45116 [Abeliophyllum distichum]|uniref:Uncharacterized protein n=1 Tax=Abeliophyllum distichum TaxID=126358 RepID=A0ABD1PGK3_9LAMI
MQFGSAQIANSALPSRQGSRVLITLTSGSMVMKLEPNLLEMLTSPAVVTVVGVYKFWSPLKELVIIIAMNNLCSTVLNNKLDNSVICFFGKLKKDEDKVEMLARDLKAMSFMNT